MDKDVDISDKYNLDEIAGQVDIRSPLVMAKLGGVNPIESDPTEEAEASPSSP